ncbi:MAG: hypothetical protein Q7I99_05370 [Acholeplasmataceae bacterium]|nr:hypothetical protein [Acholeplasmataceae bacterium]
MKKYYLEDGSKILVDDTKPIGSGGEGSVFKLAKNPNILVKVYTERALIRMPEIEHKIKAMVQKKPGLLDYNGLTIIAWPSYVIYDENKKFIGYLMRRVQAKNQLSHVITPGLQKTKFPDITWYDRLVISINLAKVMSFIHKNDTVIGDINTSDFFVYPGFEIGVVDTDSFQVTSETKLYHCKVFTPDYTPPEVFEAKKKSSVELKRIPNHDNYGLAILIFQILMMGVHPFSARIKGIMGFDGNAINYNMEHEIFPYTTMNSNIIPPKNSMPFGFFPKQIQDLFARAFDKHNNVINRPTADEWATGLRVVKDNIKKCKKNKAHYYPNHFQKCPICAREQTKDYDYLLDYFKTISRKYVKYDTDDKEIIVDENHVYDETLAGKSYTLKNSKRLAVFFNPKMLDKYQLGTRIEALKNEKVYQKMPQYFAVPQELIMQHDKVIGYVSKRIPNLFRLQTFLKNNRLGKLKITDKVKIIVARNIASMFSSLEKYNIPIEFNQIFIDKDLNPFIPDFVFLGSEDDTTKAMVFQREDYLPQEYFYDQTYKKYLKKLEEAKEKEREIEKKRLEELRKKDLELIRSPLEKKVEKKVEKEEKVIDLKSSTTVEGFEFEKSHQAIVKEVVPKEVVVEIPMEYTFEHKAKQTIRYYLAVIIHMILHDTHPFKGTQKLAERPIPYFVEHNYFLHKESVPGVEIDEKAKLLELFPNYYQRSMKKALIVAKPEKINRTSPSEWQSVLSRLSFESKKCLDSEYHYYHQSMTKCPVCGTNDTKDHTKMRQYILENKKGAVHVLLFTNKILNHLILSSLIILMIYVLNTVSINQLEALLTQINFTEKLEIIKNFIRLDDIISFFKNAYDSIVNLYRLIFGGAA